MKRFIPILFAVLFTCGFGFETKAQSPEMFKYQAVVRKGDGSLLKNTVVSMRVSIIQGTPGRRNPQL